MDRIGAVLVDTYRVERLIAEGGMGSVYEASHLRIPKKFAIKFLKVAFVENTVALLRFRREAELIATLDHPHIVTLLDYNMTEDGVPYTILEYLEGEHLGDRVGRGPLSLVDTMRIADAVCGALTAAHEKGIVHRDLKPENVILCERGAIKVVDFGIAKLRGGQELTAFNSILGTITYMAPEQLLAGQIDARADQFALGAMVYEMLSGEMPFGSEGSIPEIAERVLKDTPKPLMHHARSIYEVLLRAMSKDATERYEDISAFNRALKVATLPQEVPAPDEGLPELVGESTTISSPALPTLPSMAPITEERTLGEAGVEATRITRPPEGPSVVVQTAESKTPKKIEIVTGPMDAIRRKGTRNGLVVGVVVGVIAAVLISLMLH